MDDTIRCAGRGNWRHLADGLAQPWRMRRGRSTLAYATRWEEPPAVG
ncbi:MAG: DUF4113 domain-containing protein [Chromatiaceae bacterium]|nr:DUF4113 domain-containing protein [Chromatiaceae bacterium]